MSIRDRLKITRRGYSILREYCPGLIETKILFSLIESGAPFINIWFSAKIINEIANLRRIKVLGIYVIFTILINNEEKSFAYRDIATKDIKITYF